MAITSESSSAARSANTPLAQDAMHPIPVLGAMPDTRMVNYFDADVHLRFVLCHLLSADEWALLEPRMRELGGRLGAEVEDLSAEADHHSPLLVARDKRGERVGDVAPSRAYRDLERLFYCEYGMVAMSLRPGVLVSDRPSSLLANDALIYLATEVESGLFCPLGMTRALAYVLVHSAPPKVRDAYLPGLLSTDPTTFQTGAMFMTEKQGGSDLNTVATSARPSDAMPGWWELTGDKWFCSNAGADVILTLARPEGAGPGTRGLALFLLPKRLPDGTRNAYRIERVKDKLGMRSFASGEVTLEGAKALLVGGPGEGWLMMTEMVNLTRLGCAMEAAALARRAVLESFVHARGRMAFGRALADLPAMREQLLDMQMDSEALTSLYLEAAAAESLALAGDNDAALRARVLIPLAKYHVADEARRVVEQALEVRGGNGYIEDWPNARMLRDVHVQAIWEGTGNIAALDVGRALVKSGAGAALLANLRARLGAVTDPYIARTAGVVQHALEEVAEVVTGLADLPQDERELLMRRLTHQLARVVTATLLVEQAQWLVNESGNYRGLVQALRYLRRYLFPSSGLELDRTPLDHFDAMLDWSPTLPASAAEPLLASLERKLGGLDEF